LIINLRETACLPPLVPCELNIEKEQENKEEENRE